MIDLSRIHQAIFRNHFDILSIDKERRTLFDNLIYQLYYYSAPIKFHLQKQEEASSFFQDKLLDNLALTYASYNDATSVKWLASMGFPLSKSHDGKFIIDYALEHDNSEILELALLDNEYAKISILKDEKLLFTLLKGKKRKVVEYLLRLGAVCLGKGDASNSLMYHLIDTHDTTLFKFALKHHLPQLNVYKHNTNSPLMLIIHRDYLEMFELFYDEVIASSNSNSSSIFNSNSNLDFLVGLFDVALKYNANQIASFLIFRTNTILDVVTNALNADEKDKELDRVKSKLTYIMDIGKRTPGAVSLQKKELIGSISKVLGYLLGDNKIIGMDSNGHCTLNFKNEVTYPFNFVSDFLRKDKLITGLYTKDEERILNQAEIIKSLFEMLSLPSTNLDNVIEEEDIDGNVNFLKEINIFKQECILKCAITNRYDLICDLMCDFDGCVSDIVYVELAKLSLFKKDHERFKELLIKFPCVINKDVDGKDLLYYCISQGYLSGVARISEYFKIDIINKAYIQAIHDMDWNVTQSTSSESNLHNNLNIIEFLLQKGLDIMQPACLTGETLAHLFVNKEIRLGVWYLINNKINVDIPNNRGQTPLMLAFQRGHTNLISDLLNISDILAKDHFGRGVLSYCRESDYNLLSDKLLYLSSSDISKLSIIQVNGVGDTWLTSLNDNGRRKFFLRKLGLVENRPHESLISIMRNNESVQSEKVAVGAALSVNKLRILYKRNGLDVFHEIVEYLNVPEFDKEIENLECLNLKNTIKTQFPDKETIKSSIVYILNRIKDESLISTDLEHGGSLVLNCKEAISLVWQAIFDKEKMIAYKSLDAKGYAIQLVEFKRHLWRTLVNIRHDKGLNQTCCQHGRFMYILSSLSLLHEDVYVHSESASLNLLFSDGSAVDIEALMESVMIHDHRHIILLQRLLNMSVIQDNPTSYIVESIKMLYEKSFAASDNHLIVQFLLGSMKYCYENRFTKCKQTDYQVIEDALLLYDFSRLSFLIKKTVFAILSDEYLSLSNLLYQAIVHNNKSPVFSLTYLEADDWKALYQPNESGQLSPIFEHDWFKNLTQSQQVEVLTKLCLKRKNDFAPLCMFSIQEGAGPSLRGKRSRIDNDDAPSSSDEQDLNSGKKSRIEFPRI